MPMDYDDDDISRHNLHLAGDSRSKSSSILRPYDFPKFDFGDSLQAHLRFDTLVETEVFLGIQTQEDNQWIEDFSRGSNGMEFNSTPADSCSISKRNNVWSEATSSESVEMLLKSVGQEEMMPEEFIIPESNAGHDQSTLAKQVETGSELDTKIDEPANCETTLLQDKLLIDHPASKGHVEEQLPEAEEPSVTRDNVESVCVKGVISTNEGTHPYHNENLKEPKTTVEKPVNFDSGEDNLHFTGVDDNINSKLGMQSTSGMSEQANANVSHESCNDDGQGKHVCSKTAPEDSKILEGMTSEVSVHVHTVESSVGLVAELGVHNSQNAVEASLDCVEETADMVTNGGFELKSSEVDDKNVLCRTSVQTRKHEVKVSLINSEVAGSLEGCLDGSAVDGSDQHSIGLGSLNAGHCVVPEHKMDSSVQLTCRQDSDKKEEVQASSSKGECTYEMPVFSIDEKKGSVGSSDCIDTTNTSKSSEMVVSSSTAENEETENLEGCHSDSIVTVEKPGTHLSIAVIDSEHRIEKNLVHSPADLPESERDICKTKEDKKPLTDVGNVDPENVETLTNNQRTQSLDVSEGVKVNDVASHAQSSDSAERDADSENGKREPAVIGLPHPDKGREEAATRMVSGVSFVAEIGNVAKVEVSVADAAARTPLSLMHAKSPRTVEKSNDPSCSESPSMEAKNSLCSIQSQVHLGCNKSNLKESVNADLVGGGNHEVTMMKVEGEKELAQAVEVDKASCGSPTIISSSEPSQMEKDTQEEVMGSEVRDQFVKIQSEDPKRKDATGDDTTFTFKVNALPDTTEREPGRTWSPFPNVEKHNSSVVVEENKLSGESKAARTPTQKTPRQSARVSGGEHVHGSSTVNSERKGRRVSGKGTAKENAKKGNQVRDTNQESAKGDKVSDTLLSTSSSGTHAQSGKMPLYKHVEQSKTKLSGVTAVPNLNNSALSNSNSSPASFRQPFTDSQQVQLRAQIFVYGSLIQGTAPDEACMVSAFGSSDGRSIWEPAWRAVVERVRSKKHDSSATETPLHPHSGARASDAVKQGLHSSKVQSSPVARTSSKAIPAAVINPIIPLSSPLWSISTPLHDNLPSSGTHKGPVMDYQHAVSPLHSYQTPPVRSFVGHTSWPSQLCFPGPWLASPTSTFNASVHFQPVTMTETVKLTPVKDTSGPLTSSMKHVTSSPVQSVGPSPVYVGSSLLHDSKVIASAEGCSLDSKPRKRKKVKASDPGQVSLLSEVRTPSVVDSNTVTVLSSPVFVPASTSSAPASPASNVVLSKAATATVAVCSTDQSKKGDTNAGKVVTCSEESLSKVAEAKSQAEDAAAFAAAVVSHSEGLWRQLAKQKESGQTSEVEAKLASAAVAIAAAASVAAAAAAAAKVAFNVALQAKLMADEAFHSGKTSGLFPSSGKYPTDVHDMGIATPASILKGDNITDQSSSILVAAKEAAKRRVEAASAASKQAENLDAIVKAAELAAAAVSQAGKIVAMGEPLPLSGLIDAGPEGYWRLPEPTSVLAEKLRDSNKEQAGATGMEDSADTLAKGSREDSVMKGGMKTVGHDKVHPTERSNDSLVNGIRHSVHTGESDMRSGKDCKASETAKSSGVGSEPDPYPGVSGVQNDHNELVGALPEDSFKEGSAVEVFKHGDGLKSAWYSANVSTLEDGKAYVCYTDLPSEEGSGNLCEWIPLKGEGDKAPVIRAAHPLTVLQFQGTRKRRRAALGDYAWCVGDRVDVWIDDCWWEGVVTEKNEKDETTLKVHFPAQGETSTVRAWDLRTSRSWNEGKWVEWSSANRHNASEQSDTPQEKRQKLGSPTVSTKGKNKLANDLDSTSGKTKESNLLDLSTSEKIFGVGKITREDNKRVARRPLRTGQQKEGSRVIFGVPKPTGKKRKFMEVSKHFPANRSDKNSETNDSVKFAKYLIPQAASTRGWKLPSRNDSKEKRTAETKSRAPTSRKSSRTLPQRDNLRSASGQGNNNLRDRGKDIADSVDHDEDTSEKITHGFSASGETLEAPLSSLIAQPPSTSLKKISSLNTRSERLNRGKLPPSAGKLSKTEDKVHAGNSSKSVLEVAEPRRSNRRIQPTHRLLEGLQSSMIIPKMPSVSQDKGQKNPSKNVFTRGK